MSTSQHVSSRIRLACLVAAAMAVTSTLSLVQAPVSANTGHARAVQPAAVPVPSTAVGKLAPTGCATVDQQAACDLFAMPGTTELLGKTVPIWGFSSSGDAGTATAPGPVLVVKQGDTVTITLHNALDERVSLALPGQPAGAFGEGMSTAAGTEGAAPGAVARYSFTAGRPGTFIYEAGHTPDGARQVALGLAGALVVLPRDGTASGQAYDDEAVVVLSELDPDLNAHPDTFDMRSFRPGWRLINGKPFPSTPEIGTDQGHTVLLRYVNVGSMTHPMSLLGADQLEVARDGHAVAHPTREVVAEVEAGSTRDTLVSMPSGPEVRVTLFEEGAHLDNVGQTEADPTRVAAGGMMVFLDTLAPVVSDDLVGPVATHVSVTPQVSDGLAPVQVGADLSDTQAGGSNLTAAELMVDDPSVAVGFGLPMTGTFGDSTAHVTATVPETPPGGDSCTPDTGPTPLALSCLAAGKHVIYVRGQDAAGNWGVVGSVVLNLPKTGPSTTAGTLRPSPASGDTPITVSTTGDDSNADGTITDAEYFVDTVRDDGSGTAMDLNRIATVVSETSTIPVTPPTGKTCADPVVAASCLSEGPHHVYVHSKDSLGLWGPVLDLPLTVDRTGPGVDAAAVSPNPSNGKISSPGNSGYLRVSALVTDRDDGGALQDHLVAAEGFFAPKSSTPAPGTGFGLLAVDGRYDSTGENVYGLIPLSQVRAKVDGSYQVYVRAKDEAGNWGPLFAMPLTVDKTAPVLGALGADPTPTAGAGLLTLSAQVTNDTSFQAAEFWRGSTDPGVGKGTRTTVGFVDGKAVVTAPLTALPLGPTRFNLRVRDMAGNWSNAVGTDVLVTRADKVFSDNFDAGSLAAWSGRTDSGAGAMAVSAAAGVPTGGSNLGLAVTGPGVHYVRDNTPAAEHSYHARFAFSPNTFTAGTSPAVTLLEGRATTGYVFQIQFRTIHSVSHQVRVRMALAGGGSASSAWRTLAAGPHDLQVDWGAGPAAGPDHGSLTFSVDGTAVANLGGDTGALAVETVWLGLVRGMNASSVGTAYFDSFASARVALP